jgi:ribonuclease Z
VINRKYLVDTGWAAAVRMLDLGMMPADLEYLFITHRHRDHTLGLPQLLLYRRIVRQQQGRDIPPLKITGPVEDLETLYEKAWAWLGFPEDAPRDDLIPLSPGEGLDTDDFSIFTCAAHHTSAGLVYRFKDKRSGAEIGFTGDTLYHPRIVSHLAGVSLLIHDACYSDDAPLDQPGLHGRPKQAAQAAKEVGARRLALIHGSPRLQRQKVRAAREIFRNSFWPKVGQTVRIG